MGHVSWLKDLNEEDYHFTEDKRCLITQSAFYSLNAYETSVPTSPSAGRIYRRTHHSTDKSYVFVVENDPADNKYQLHHPHLVEFV